MNDHARLHLESHPASARAVRAAVVSFCEGRDVDVDGVVLCASELVTNALLHGEPPLSVELVADATKLRVSMFDGGRGQVTARGDLVANATSGRGLAIVERLSSRWGIQPTDGGGKAVWFEVEFGKR